MSREEVEKALENTCSWGGCPLKCCEHRATLATEVLALLKVLEAARRRTSCEVATPLSESIAAYDALKK